jgi:plasmid stability protein
MAQLVVRNLEDEVKEKLKERARRNGRSTEEEVREILRSSVLAPSRPRPPLGSRLARRFGRVGLQGPVEELRGPARPADLS